MNNRAKALTDYIKPEDLRVLVVGCGHGSAGSDIRAALPGREVWGIEADPALADTARPKLDRVITGQVDRLAPFPLPHSRFDCILCAAGFAPAGSMIEVLRKLRPCLTPNGRLICQVRNPAHWSAVACLLAGEMPRATETAITPLAFRIALYEARYRLLSEDALQAPPPPPEPGHVTTLDVLTEAGVRLGIPAADVHENLAVAEKIFTAEIAPPVVLPTAGTLAPATLGGASIVVLTYNSMSTIDACVKSVLRTLRKDDELILVDNASKDGTQTRLTQFAEQNPQISAILNDRNLGFSAGSNVGIRASRGAYITLLNPDTEVWPGWLESFTTRLQDPTIGAVGPVSDRIAGLQFVGHFVRSKTESESNRNPLLPSEEGEGRAGVVSETRQSPYSPSDLAEICSASFRGQTIETRLLIGLCLMSRRETWNKVGLLDEDLFLGSDDLELSWRLKTHGLKLAIGLDTFVRHIGGVSFSSAPKEEVKAMLYDSTERLLAKVRIHAGWRPLDTVLWGIEITHQ